jgi:hypothetical protein
VQHPGQTRLRFPACPNCFTTFLSPYCIALSRSNPSNASPPSAKRFSQILRPQDSCGRSQLAPLESALKPRTALSAIGSFVADVSSQQAHIRPSARKCVQKTLQCSHFVDPLGSPARPRHSPGVPWVDISPTSQMHFCHRGPQLGFHRTGRQSCIVPEASSSIGNPPFGRI